MGAIISCIGSELAYLIIDLIQQGKSCEASPASNHLAIVGIISKVQSSPATSELRSVRFFQPLARAIDFQPGTVDQNVNGAVRRMLPVVAAIQWLPAMFGSAAERGVIVHTQIQSQHIKDKTQKPSARAQP